MQAQLRMFVSSVVLEWLEAAPYQCPRKLLSELRVVGRKLRLDQTTSGRSER